MLPHIIWLFKTGFMPFTYAEGRFEKVAGPAFLVVPILFVFWQGATLLPAIITYLASFGRPFMKKRPCSFDETFLYAVTFGPALLACGAALFSGGVLRNMWATPFWNFIGLWAVFNFAPDFSPKRLRRFARISVLLCMLGLTGFFSVEALAPYVTHKAKRINFSGPLFAEEISKIWHDRYKAPLRYVVGDTWIGGNIAWYAPDRPHQLTDGDYKISPWINPGDIKKYGGVIVWCGTHCDVRDEVPATPNYIETLFPQAEIQPPLTFPQATGARVPDGLVNWAIVPPAGLEENP
jgi:hypothetical protein